MNKSSIMLGTLAASAALGLVVSRQNAERQLQGFDDQVSVDEARRALEARERQEEAELERQAEEYARIKAHRAALEQVIYDAAKDKRARKAAKRLATR